MYNQSFQPSFGQQNFGQQQSFGGQVQSQYRGLNRAFQPTGNVQSFYQPQQTTSYGSNYHTSSYVGNQPNHDRSFREDSQSPSMQTGNYHTSSYVGNQPNHDRSFREDSQSPSSFASNRGQSFGVTSGFQSSFQPSAQSAGFQGSQNYHTQNYVGNQPNHDAYLREDSLRASSYATGRSQGITTFNSTQGTYNVNTPTSQIMQSGFGASRNF